MSAGCQPAGITAYVLGFVRPDLPFGQVLG
jgi:hypothetical protein